MFFARSGLLHSSNNHIPSQYDSHERSSSTGEVPMVHLTLIHPTSSEPYKKRSLKFGPHSWCIRVGRASGSEEDLRPAAHNAWYNSRVMSRDHAIFRMDPENKTITLEDIGSMHGTYVNDNRLSRHAEAELLNGDIIKFGTEVARGPDSFPPLEVRVEFGSSNALERNRGPPVVEIPSNRFKAPGYSDEEEFSEDESVIVADSVPAHIRAYSISSSSMPAMDDPLSDNGSDVGLLDQESVSSDHDEEGYHSREHESQAIADNIAKDEDCVISVQEQNNATQEDVTSNRPASGAQEADQDITIHSDWYNSTTFATGEAGYHPGGVRMENIESRRFNDTNSSSDSHPSKLQRETVVEPPWRLPIDSSPVLQPLERHENDHRTIAQSPVDTATVVPEWYLEPSQSYRSVSFAPVVNDTSHEVVVSDFTFQTPPELCQTLVEKSPNVGEENFQHHVSNERSPTRKRKARTFSDEQYPSTSTTDEMKVVNTEQKLRTLKNASDDIVTSSSINSSRNIDRAVASKDVIEEEEQPRKKVKMDASVSGQTTNESKGATLMKYGAVAFVSATVASISTVLGLAALPADYFA